MHGALQRPIEDHHRNPPKRRLAITGPQIDIHFLSSEVNLETIDH